MMSGRSSVSGLSGIQSASSIGAGVSEREHQVIFFSNGRREGGGGKPKITSAAEKEPKTINIYDNKTDIIKKRRKKVIDRFNV